MLILGIESSCDDTSAALLDCSEQGHVVISEKTASQIEVHKKYGGVVPEIAGRMHAEKIVPLIESVFVEATPDKGSMITKPDVIAVTAGPGLITGLIVGVEAVRTLSYAWDVPLVAVNHIEGHIYSVEIPNPKSQAPNKSQIQNPNNKKSNLQFPALCLVVSGGHTELILMKDHGDYTLLGATKDDAAGECFDKVARLLGLPYPGGPQISKLAEDGDPNAIPFPRPMIKDKSYDFSFAGLKTAALYWLRDHRPLALPSPPNGQGTNHLPSLQRRRLGGGAGDITVNDFCASIEQAIVDVLVAKTLRAAAEYKPASIVVVGGVSANKKLRTIMKLVFKKTNLTSDIRYPASEYCMDNAAMIAAAGFYHAKKKGHTRWQDIKADPNWRLA